MNDSSSLLQHFQFKHLLLRERTYTILEIVLHRPQVANAFNTQMAKELSTIFTYLNLENQQYRVIILTGAGERAFCAGADLKERKGMSDQAWFKQHLIFEKMLHTILDCPLPIIGAINGSAYGGGCELAASLDFIYAVETAKFAQTEVTLGIIPGLGGTQNLARAIGERRAKELIMSGQSFSALEAFEWGLVNKLCDSSSLAEEVFHCAQRIADNAPLAVQKSKEAIHRGLQMSLQDGLAFEISAYQQTIRTKDRIEGVLAFNEKRKAHFLGK